MTNNPTVTVILSTNNRPAMLSRAIDSVLNQSFDDFELIVVDDGQEISAQDVVTQFADPRIKYIHHDVQKGCAGTRVTGIQAARGALVAYLDDDDVWESSKLAIQTKLLLESPKDVGFSFTAVTQEFDHHTQVTQVPDGVGDFYERALSNFSGFLSVTLMFKREVFDQVGVPDPTFPSHTDIEFILRVSKVFKGLGINQPLTRVNSKTDHAHMGIDFSNRIRGREMLLDKHRLEFAKRPRILATHLFKLAWFYRSDGNFNQARQVYWQAFYTYPKPWYLVHFFSMTMDGLGYRLFKKMKKIYG